MNLKRYIASTVGYFLFYLVLVAIAQTIICNAATSLENGKIYFMCGYGGDSGEIYSMDPDGSSQTRLTFNFASDGVPSPSPDGTKVVFESNRTGNWEIFTMNADGSGVIQLTRNQGGNSLARWSPDGSKIAFYSNRDGDPEIFVMNTDGSQQVQLTENSVVDVYAAWSPDGSRILFTSQRDNPPGDQAWEIYVMDADGSHQTRLTSNNYYDAGGTWSPDGSKIAFFSNRDGNNDIYVMNADGTDQVRLTSNSGNNQNPAWSPDGTKIAFASSRDGLSEIYLMNADGSNQSRLTYNYGFSDGPAWSAIMVTEDADPPVISNLSANPHTLWPPNHRMVDIVVCATVTDDFDPAPTFFIQSVSSNEDDQGFGGGDASPDWIIAGDHAVQLRAERNGNGDGRIYTIVVAAVDQSGNTATSEVSVTVPKNQSGKK